MSIYIPSPVNPQLTFSNLAAFQAATNIGVGVTYIQVTAVVGNPTPLGNYQYGTVPLMYKNEGTSSTGIYGEQYICGYYWKPLYTVDGDGLVNAGQFGTVGNASYNSTTGIATGTDNTSMIQAALDWAMQNSAVGVRIPYGEYVISDTLYMGYGQAYITLWLVGGFKGSQENKGVVLYPTATDRPAISISASRQSIIRGISIVGQNYTWLNTIENNFPSTASSWLNSSITPSGSNPGGIQQHSPYAAIAIDPCGGSSPTDHYPTMPTPAWTGVSGSYNLATSSDTWIDCCIIAGFGVGIVQSPNGSSQGDFLKVTSCEIDQCVYGVAVGTTQSRNVRISDVNFNQLFACITGSVFGSLEGEFSGIIENIALGACYQLAYFYGLGSTGCLNFKAIYCENCVMIGTFIASATGISVATITFESCHFYVTEIHGTIPPYYINSDGAHTFVLNDVLITGSYRITNLIGPGSPMINLTGCNWASGLGIPGSTSVSNAFMQAVNVTGGLVMGASRYNSTGINYSTLKSNEGTYYPSNTVFNSASMFDENASMSAFSNRYPITQASKYFTDSNGRRWDINQVIQANYTMTTGSSVAPSWTNDTMTFTVANTWTTNAHYMYIPQPGFLLLHQTTGTLFLVNSSTGPDGNGAYLVSTTQMNNMQVNTTTWAISNNLLTDFTLGGGYTIVIDTSKILPATVYYGNFTSGSNAVANVSRGDGYGLNTTTFYAVGDTLQSMLYNEPTSVYASPFQLDTQIASITNGNPASMTLTQQAVITGRFPIVSVPIH